MIQGRSHWQQLFFFGLQAMGRLTSHRGCSYWGYSNIITLTLPKCHKDDCGKCWHIWNGLPRTNDSYNTKYTLHNVRLLSIQTAFRDRASRESNDNKYKPVPKEKKKIKKRKGLVEVHSHLLTPPPRPMKFLPFYIF